MKAFTSLALLALGTLGLANPEPLTGESTTRVALDQSPELLSEGELTLHVLRTDDLLSDFTPSHERSLILERLTHVILKVQLDHSAATASPVSAPALRVNDESIDLSSLVGPNEAKEPRSLVQVIKAEAMRLPREGVMVEGKKMHPKELVGLAEHALPKGIVSVELSIEEESAPPSSPNEFIEGLTLAMQSFNVFVKINSIESLSVPHSTVVMIPLLKLEINFDDETKKGVKSASLKTFALRKGGKGPNGRQFGRPRVGLAGGKPHHEQEGSDDEERPHRHHHEHHSEDDESEHPRRPHHRRPDSDSEENVEEEGRHSRHRHHEFFDSENEEERPHHWHPHPHHHHDGPPAFVKWVADLLGFAPPHRGPRGPHAHHHHGPPPPGFVGEDGEEPHHRPHHHRRPSSSEEEHIEGEHHHGEHHRGEHVDAAEGDEEKPHSHHHHHHKGFRPQGGKGHFHAHGHHGHFHHRHHSRSIFLALVFAKLAMIGGLIFVAVRKIKAFRAKKAEGAVRLAEEEEAEEKEQLLSEKEGLPVYVEDGVAKA